MKRYFTLCLLLLCGAGSLWANNLQIGTPALTDKNTTTGQVSIQFDISWENSWRTSSAPNNWDAVWLFVKYKKVSDGNWYHATLNTSASTHSTGTQGGGAILNPRSDGIGAYYYRSANGSGTFSSSGVKLRWNYAANGIGNNLAAEISDIDVYGIEMVYIPQGAFYVGSGGSEYYPFYTYGGNAPYQISSEGAINVGQTNGSLWADEGIETSTIPAAFPKGYNAFYCMKYEITQEQYVHFLNTLTRAQQNTRTNTNLASGVTSVSNRYVMITAQGQYRNGIRCDATIPATSPITFYCDFNGNGVPNEANDGQNIACNYLSWADGTAYSDWCGLRPMTELEFEKACRGTAPSVPNEYAWGSTSITSAGTSASNITNSGAANEGSNISGANCNNYYNGSVGGPLRVGCFSGGSRQSSGASYYGVMEMSGNLWERIVTVGNSSGRAYTGNHGNGVLNINGNSDIVNCPDETAYGSGFRGGSWNNYYHYFSSLQVSGRIDAADTGSNRLSGIGFRCIGGLN